MVIAHFKGMTRVLSNFYKSKWLKTLWCALFLVLSSGAWAQNSALSNGANTPQLHAFYQLERAGLLFVDEQATPLYAKDEQRLFIPASTTKLITALLALRHWGDNYRFKTEFYVNKAPESQAGGGEKITNLPVLLIKGYGDPFLVSEELARMAKQLAKRLKQQHIKALASIQLDVSYYQGGGSFSGASQTDNPYDAVSSALAANFNTLYLRKTDVGFESAEPQTPMTTTALALARTIKTFKQTPRGLEKRVNLGQDETVAQRYFAELFAIFLRQEGIAVSDQVGWQVLDSSFAPIYVHQNQRTLADVIRPMMQYSTNFIANQLALNLSQAILGGAASTEKVAQLYQQQLAEQFHWRAFRVEEGAGLSRENRLSPEQLIEVLEAFKPWRHLLPEIIPNVYAKSGTLQGVSALAGYVYHKKQWYPFAFMINEAVLPYGYRNVLARELEACLRMPCASP